MITALHSPRPEPPPPYRLKGGAGPPSSNHWRIQPTVWGGGQVLAEGPNLPLFSSFSMDLGYFILNLLIFCFVIFYFMLIFKAYFGVFLGQTGRFMPLGRALALNAPLDPPVPPIQAACGVLLPTDV